MLVVDGLGVIMHWVLSALVRSTMLASHSLIISPKNEDKSDPGRRLSHLNYAQPRVSVHD